MRIKPVNSAVRIATIDILSRFLHKNQWNYERFTTLQKKTYEKYIQLAQPIRADLLHRKFDEGKDIDMMEKDLFMYLGAHQDQEHLASRNNPEFRKLGSLQNLCVTYHA